MKTSVIFSTVLAVMLLSSFAAAEDMVVIGNPSVSTSELRKQEVKYIFLGKKTKWDDGSKIVFVIQEDSKNHENFLESYIQKDRLQFDNHWKKQIFTGRGSIPKTVKNDQEMIKFVGETLGAVGYVSSNADLENVIVVKVK